MIFTIFVYVFCALIAGVMFYFTSKLSMPIRIGLLIAVFVVLPILVNVLIFSIVGDKAADDAITIVPKESDNKR